MHDGYNLPDVAVVVTTTCGSSLLTTKKAELHEVIRLSVVGQRGDDGQRQGESIDELVKV